MMDYAPSEAGGSPLYQQVFSTLREEILNGLFDSEQVLPSEKQLEERFGVSRITIRRAVEELERAGLAERARGRATRITERRPPIFADVDDELANMLAAVSDLETTLQHFRWVPADKFLAATLQVPRGEKVLWIVRTRARDGRPVMHSVLHLPHWVGEGLKRGELEAGAIVELVRRRGIRLASGEQTMRAIPCPEDLAPRLDLRTGEPVFFVRRLIRNEEGRPVMFNDASFRWDCFAYSMVLEPTRPRLIEPRAAEARVGNGLKLLQR
jgi:GntR family transcriptional regulator